MKQKVSTVPKGELSILGIGPHPRKDRNVKSILTESRSYFHCLAFNIYRIE